MRAFVLVVAAAFLIGSLAGCAPAPAPSGGSGNSTSDSGSGY